MMITPNQQCRNREERRNLAILQVVRQMPFLLEEENKGKAFHHFDTDIAHSLGFCDCISWI